MDGYFCPASALWTILLLVTGVALFLTNKFSGTGRESLVG
jgi:uncharacterized iron-regulated membrane protein